MDALSAGGRNCYNGGCSCYDGGRNYYDGGASREPASCTCLSRLPPPNMLMLQHNTLGFCRSSLHLFEMQHINTSSSWKACLCPWPCVPLSECHQLHPGRPLWLCPQRRFSIAFTQKYDRLPTAACGLHFVLSLSAAACSFILGGPTNNHCALIRLPLPASAPGLVCLHACHQIHPGRPLWGCQQRCFKFHSCVHTTGCRPLPVACI